MIKTQIQLPEQLYQQAKRIAEQREWSLAEVIRRGIEHMALLYPIKQTTAPWRLPVLRAEQFISDFDRMDFRALATADETREQG